MIEYVGDVSFGILVARNLVFHRVDSVGFVYSTRAWEAQPLQPAHSFLPASVPVELTRVGYDDTGSTVIGSSGRSIEHTLNEIEHRSLADVLLAGDTVRQDQWIELAFWEEYDDPLLRSDARREVDRDMFDGWTSS